MAVKGSSRPRLPWLLLLVAVTAVLPSDADYTDADIDSLVLNRIMRNPQLKRFPKTAGYPEAVQYGVLILVSQRDFARGNTNIQLSPTPNQFTIDNRYTVQPSLQVAVNYLVARPDSPVEARDARRPREHAEKKLLNKLRALLRNFAQQNGAPGMIILHTRATPCPTCTDGLLAMNNIIRRFYPQTRFTVTYSEDTVWRNSGMTESENMKNRRRLRRTGMNVLQVDLPPSHWSGLGGGFSAGGGGFGTGGGPFGRGGQTRPYSTTSLLPNTNFRPLGTQTGWNVLRNRWTPRSNGYNMQRPTYRPMLQPALNANNVLRRWRVRIPRG